MLQLYMSTLFLTVCFVCHSAAFLLIHQHAHPHTHTHTHRAPEIPQVFSLTTTSAGLVTLTMQVVPKWSTAASSARSNLNATITVVDAANNVLASAAGCGMSTQLNVPAAGTYYVFVSSTGVGDPLAGGYSSYASRGQYALQATFPYSAVVVVPSPEPVVPSPSPEPVVPSPSPVMPSPSPEPVVPSPSPEPVVPSPSPVMPSPSPEPVVPSPSPVVPSPSPVVPSPSPEPVVPSPSPVVPSPSPVVPSPSPVVPSPSPEPVVPSPSPVVPSPSPVVPSPSPAPVVPSPSPEPVVPYPSPVVPSPSPSPSPSPQPTIQYMTIVSITNTKAVSSKNAACRVEVTVVSSATGAPLGTATVTGTWASVATLKGWPYSASASTIADGSASSKSKSLSNSPGNGCGFTVTSVVLAGYQLDANAPKVAPTLRW